MLSIPTIIIEILEVLKNIINYDKDILLIIRPHKREADKNYRSILGKYTDNNLQIIVDRESRSVDLIRASDLVCGMSSMFLIEATILGKPILSIQIGLNKNNPFVLDRKGITKSILDNESLKNNMKKIILENKLPICEFGIVKNSIEIIIKNMEKYLCRN